ncbi:hypothetical protein [Longirhabdus pacifica]|uniref:hypothetical protein n=1 Tax=Longirhabdus pacifica TaxID=2305227 RepID=UPI001008EB9F|nr:hypothetical protein [Longirhabdus pacifica]
MGTKEDTMTNVKSFLDDKETKAMLITGTHQYQKHRLVMKGLKECVEKPSTILFRVNSMENFDSIFNNSKNFKTGTAYALGEHSVFFDSLNKITWSKTQREYDYCILYPLDSVISSSHMYTILDDLYERRDIKKIFLVSWTDKFNYQYHKELGKYYSTHAIYDALQEDADYHERVLNTIKNTR